MCECQAIVVKCFEWPRVRKALDKRSLFTTAYILMPGSRSDHMTPPTNDKEKGIGLQRQLKLKNV